MANCLSRRGGSTLFGKDGAPVASPWTAPVQVFILLVMFTFRELEAINLTVVLTVCQTSLNESILKERDCNGDVIGLWCRKGARKTDGLCLLCNIVMSCTQHGTTAVRCYASSKNHVDAATRSRNEDGDLEPPKLTQGVTDFSSPASVWCEFFCRRGAQIRSSTCNGSREISPVLVRRYSKQVISFDVCGLTSGLALSAVRQPVTRCHVPRSDTLTGWP